MVAVHGAMAKPNPSMPGCEAPLAIYANHCEIGHNAFEFLLDFGQYRPEIGAVHVHSRIVAGPVQAKLFARLFVQAVERFEAVHGAIAELDDDDVLGALIGNIPDFERRAQHARARPLPGDAPSVFPAPAQR